MHRARLFWRKEILSKEIATEISIERCLHIKKLELVNTSTQETEVFISRMTSERKLCRKETCNVVLDMDNSCQQNIENNSPLGEDINVVDSVKAYRQNSEAGDSNRRSRNVDASVQYDENLCFLVSEIDNSSNPSKINNRVSERCQLGLNEDEKNDAEDIVTMDRTTDTFRNFVHSGSKLDNSQIYIVKSNQANKNTDRSSSTENFKSPNYKANQIPPKFPDGRRKMKHRGTENNLTETSTKRKLHKLKSGDTNDSLFSVAPQKERNVKKSVPKVSSVSDTDQTPRSFEDMITKYTDDDCKRIEADMKILNNDNTLTRREDMKNNIKKCGSCLKIFDNEEKGEEVGNETSSRSVTDLITFFENLCPKKQPSVKSKIKSFESKQGLKKDRILNVDRIVKSIATPSSSTQKDLNISSKTGVGKRSVVKEREVILLDSDADNKKTPIVVVPENILPAINTDDRKGNNEVSSKDKLLDLNGVKRKITITSKKHIPDLDTRKCQNVLSPSTKLSNCKFCKGNCVHFEQAVKRSDDNANMIKEHRFVFSDDLFNEMEQPRVSYPTRLRSRFTRKHTGPIYPRPLRGLENSQNDEESGLNFVSCTRKEYGSSLPGNRNQTAVRNRAVDGSLNLSPLIENSIEVRKHEGKYISERKKPKSSEIGCNVKRFIGIFLALVISVVFYKGVFESLW